MFTLMLVDDEYMILKGIPKLLDWTSLHVKIVKTERSPLAALDYLRQNKVDILLSDMNMDELPGTKFLPAVRKIQPNIQIIVLSGYEDFSYAKTSLEQGAIDYLDKPVDPDELEETVKKAEGQIIKARDIKNQATLAKRIKVRDVLRGRRSIKDLDTKYHDFYLIALLKPQDKVRSKLMQLKYVLGYQEDKAVIYTIIPKTSIYLERLNHELLPLVSNEIVLSVASEENIMAFGRKLQKKAEQVLFYQNSQKIIKLDQDFALIKVAELVSALDIKKMTDKEFQDFIRQSFSDLGTHNNSIKDAKYFSRLLLMKIYGEHHEMDSDFATLIAEVEDSSDVQRLMEILVKFFKAHRRSQKKYPGVVAQAIKYLETNYSDELTLKKVAAVLHLNAVYLGALFKKSVGQSFARYLNNYRIAKSIELMSNTDKNINEIAVQVGYINVNYFFRIFKKQTQMAPSEYRRMIKQKG